MKKAIINIVYITCLILLFSCYSKLSVRVHSFDMAKMKTSPQYQEQIWNEQYRYYQTLIEKNYFDTIRIQFVKKIRSAIDTLVKRNLLSANAKDDVYDKIHFIFEQRISKFESTTKRASDVLEVLLKLKSDSLQKLYSAARGDFDLAKLNLIEFAQSAGSEIGQPEWDRQIFNSVKTAVAPISLSNTYGSSIANDDMASFVIKAPEEYWQKYKTSFYTNNTDLSKSGRAANINITRVITVIGNSDIAIKMDGPGNFIVKGVRLDADQAFRTSFKVLGQSIKYLTYTSGLTTNTTTASTSTTAPDVAAVPELKSFNKNKAQAASLNSRYQQLTDTFLKIIDNYKIDLKSGDPVKRKAAVQAIKKAYLYYKSQLPLN